jgi:hypothetical protein
MVLFDHTGARRARCPVVLFPADPADDMTAAALRYDPVLTVVGESFVFGNGVRLHGPVEVTAEIAGKAGLPGGTAAAYYADIVEGGGRRSGPDSLRWQDAERLVRGLAAWLGGIVHDERPPMDLRLRVAVYSLLLVPAEQVIAVLQPHVATGELITEPDMDVPEAYCLLTRDPPVFSVRYWPPPQLASRPASPPPALGNLAGKQPCRWDLQAECQVATAPRVARLAVGAAALALTGRAAGVAIDTYGFLINRPEDLLPRWPIAGGTAGPS